MCNSSIPVLGVRGSGGAGGNNPPTPAPMVNSSVRGHRLRVINNFVLLQVVAERWTTDGRNVGAHCACATPTVGGMGWEGAFVHGGNPAGRIAAGRRVPWPCRDVLCRASSRSEATGVLRGTSACPPLLRKLPSRKQGGGGGGWQLLPCTGQHIPPPPPLPKIWGFAAESSAGSPWAG